MFITIQSQGYDRSGTQKARGSFLILFSNEERTSKGDLKLWGCVRTVTLSQLGHWMMGRARIGGHTITLSGSYGADGLTKDKDKQVDIDKYLHELPEALTHQFWHPEHQGHNSCGSEGPQLQAWANNNEQKLRSKQ